MSQISAQSTHSKYESIEQSALYISWHECLEAYHSLCRLSDEGQSSETAGRRSAMLESLSEAAAEFRTQVYTELSDKNSLKYSAYLESGAVFRALKETSEALSAETARLSSIDNAGISEAAEFPTPELSKMFFKTNLAFSDYLNLTREIELDGNHDLIVIIFVLSLSILILVASTIVFIFMHTKSNQEKLLSQEMTKHTIRIQEQMLKKFSYELHDGIAQDLKALDIRLELFKKKAAGHKKSGVTESRNGEKSAEAEIDELIMLNKKAVSEIRNLCYNMSPPDLNGKDFAVALDILCSSFNKKYAESGENVRKYSLTVLPDADLKRLSAEKELHLFRIINEALNNAENHAEATEVHVLVRGTPDGELLVHVSDDGIGFDENQIRILRAGGLSKFGLAEIRERATIIGGKAEIKSEKGMGTTVIIKIKPDDE